jgi:phospholipid/cholesterol/gamma-HCH transport system substrate-binding protein
METKAHYALVGFFAIALIAAGALFTVWLGQLRFDQAFKEFDVVFEGPVRGLTEGGEVRFNGIKVGEVTDLRLDENDPKMVVASIRVEDWTPVMRDSVAQLEPQGLTGLNYIQLNPGSPEGEPLLARPGEVPRLQSRPAQIESLLASSEGIAQAASEALAKINNLLTEKSLDDMEAIIANVRTLSDQLAGDGEAEKGLVVQLRDAVARADATTEEVSRLVNDANSVLAGDVTTMLNETTRASIGVSDASEEVVAILEDMREPLARFSHEGLGDLTLAIDDLRRLLNELETIAASVEDNPTAFVAGARREEVEIPR